jgi:hypothetical protein
MYYSKDFIEPGSVVGLDSSIYAGVQKTEKPYQSDILGVVSTNPGLILGDASPKSADRPVMLALNGRVPVRVTAQNGDINPGDLLTSSSIPGVAMKADKTGTVIGIAMESYSGVGEGEVLTFLKPMNHQAKIAEIFDQIDVNSQNFGLDVLTQLSANPKNDSSSDTVTDRLIAGIEMVSPKITVDELFAKKIVAGQIEGLDVVNDRLSALEKQVATLSASLSQHQGSSESATAQKENELIDRITKNLDSATKSATVTSGILSMGSLDSSGLTTLPGTLRVQGNGLFEGILTVLDNLTTNNFIVNGVSTFFSDAIFKGKVNFEKAPTFAQDSGGFATITKGTDRVEVKFENEFENEPIINTGVSFDVDSLSLEQTFFKQGYHYIIVDRSKKGFTIVLNKKAGDDVTFTWTAVQIKDAKTARSTFD